MPRIKEKPLKEVKEVFSFRFPKKYIAFLDEMADGVFIRDRTHALKIILGDLSRKWDECKSDSEKEEYTKKMYIAFLNGKKNVLEKELDRVQQDA